MKIRKTVALALLTAVMALQSGCTWMVGRGIDVGAPIIMNEGLVAFYEETDPIIAETAAAANLKLLETMLQLSPNNEDLLNNASMGLAAYGMSFVEYDMERAELWYKYGDGNENDKDLAEFHKQRALKLYQRALVYGFRSLSQSGDGEDLVELLKVKKIVDMQTYMNNLREQLKEIDEDQLPALFWTTASWALYLNLSRDPSSGGVFPIVKAMIVRIKELDQSYFFGMPNMFDAMLYSMPPLLGGDETEAYRAFVRVQDQNKGRFLLAKVLKARFFCKQFDKPEEAVELLQEVVNVDTSGWPSDMNLMNVMAKQKAELYLKYADDLF